MIAGGQHKKLYTDGTNIPSLKLFHDFDGIDDHITIDGSDAVGSPFDFEKTSTFTIAIRFRVDAKPTQYAMLFCKIPTTGAGIGYQCYIDYTASTITFTLTDGTNTITCVNPLTSIPIGSDLVWGCIYNVGGFIDTKTYNVSGLVGTAIHLSCSTFTASSGSIKNTNKLNLFSERTTGVGSFFKGRGYGFFVSTPSVLTTANLDSLAALMFTHRVENHALYGNRAGYFKHYGSQFINMAQYNGNGTYVGFTTP